MRRAADTLDTTFTASREHFEALVEFLGAQASSELTHAQLEEHLSVAGRELTRLQLQDHVDVRAAREQRLDEVAETDGTIHSRVERGHTRGVATIFGEVEVTRLAYRALWSTNLYPADAVLNLPAEKYSFGLRRLAALEAGRGSFEQTVAAIGRATGLRLGPRQVGELTARAAVDIDEFYLTRELPTDAEAQVLALSFDGKGIVMRPDALRAATGKAAGSQKLATRLSKGGKRNRKRMAEVGSVFQVVPAPRTPADIIATATSPHGRARHRRQVADRQRRRRGQPGHRLGVRRSGPPRSRPPVQLDRPGRRQQPPD